MTLPASSTEILCVQGTPAHELPINQRWKAMNATQGTWVHNTTSETQMKFKALCSRPYQHSHLRRHNGWKSSISLCVTVFSSLSYSLYWKKKIIFGKKRKLYMVLRHNLIFEIRIFASEPSLSHTVPLAPAQYVRWLLCHKAPVAYTQPILIILLLSGLSWHM